MSKQDMFKNKLSGTTKKTIGKKPIPPETSTPKVNPQKKAVTPDRIKKSSANKKAVVFKQVNFKIPEHLHFKAKIAAMEEGKKLKEYLTGLVINDLQNRGKL